jgi:hypothetical protein
MIPRYAVTPEGEGPIAIFNTLEDAVDWANLRYGPGAFQIEPVQTKLTTPVRGAPAGAA